MSACRHSTADANALAKLYDRSFLRLLDHAPRNGVAHFMLVKIFIEAGGNELLHAELDLPFFCVDSQDLGFDDLASSQHVLRMVDVFLRADFADVYEAF